MALAPPKPDVGLFADKIFQKRGATAGRLCNLLPIELFFGVNSLALCISASQKEESTSLTVKYCEHFEEHETFALHFLLQNASIEYPSRVRERGSLCLQFE